VNNDFTRNGIEATMQSVNELPVYSTCEFPDGIENNIVTACNFSNPLQYTQATDHASNLASFGVNLSGKIIIIF